MISDKLHTDMTEALKAGDKPRLSVIRMLRAELKNAQIAAGDTLDDEQEQKVLASYAKKRKEAREQALEIGRSDLAANEQFEYDVTMSYLPAQLDDAELESIVKAKIKETGASSPREMGQVMKAVMEVVGNQAEGSKVSSLVKRLLTG